ncbi:hypothetical protein ABZ784_03430 [Streptomyces tendae]|uniref:hypothetical protein n=1 Tax=Streptomyces tendae TaxID=1932 RepID=UPI0034047030
MTNHPDTGRLAYIYTLLDDTGRPRYVGQTSRPLDGFRGRAYVHWAHRRLDADRGNVGLNTWLRTLDQPPKTLVLEAVPYAQRFEAEAFWTTCFRWATGPQLLNVNTGSRVHPEVTARISATKRRLPAQAARDSRIGDVMNQPTPDERAAYEQLRREMTEGFALITSRIDHVVGRHDFAADGACPSCEARQHPQA